MKPVKGSVQQPNSYTNYDRLERIERKLILRRDPENIALVEN